jgi:hypothetical protein
MVHYGLYLVLNTGRVVSVHTTEEFYVCNWWEQWIRVEALVGGCITLYSF